MKSTRRTTKASLQAMATRTALLPVFAVSLATLGFGLFANANERKATLITFDVPGAGQGTLGYAITPDETITGPYIDSGTVMHGYVRARDGAITTFDVPGAGTASGEGTFPYSINPPGTTAGNYIEASSVSHAFLRARDGAITTFDVPGAGTGAGQGTLL